MNLKVTVRYDGADFAGWQTQPGRRTVQGELEAALARIAQRPVRIHGAGRTDAGAHALGQVFSCDWPARGDLSRLRRSLCRMTGPGLRVEAVEPAPPAFHARKSAKSKRYAYALALASEPDPFSARHAWTVTPRLDLDRLAALLTRMEGRHDFAGFQASGAATETSVRTLYSVELMRGGVVAPLDSPDLWRIVFHGDGFLYKMVRNLVGAAVDIARGHLPPETLDARLAAPAPYHGHTAPAHGLTLLEVRY